MTSNPLSRPVLGPELRPDLDAINQIADIDQLREIGRLFRDALQAYDAREGHITGIHLGVRDCLPCEQHMADPENKPPCDDYQRWTRAIDAAWNTAPAPSNTALPAPTKGAP